MKAHYDEKRMAEMEEKEVRKEESDNEFEMMNGAGPVTKRVVEKKEISIVPMVSLASLTTGTNCPRCTAASVSECSVCVVKNGWGKT